MKGGKGCTEKEIIQQLKGAQCFVVYCREIGRLFWNKKDFLEGYEYRFVSIKNINVNKRPTRPSTKKEKHDRPEKMLKIDSAKGVHFHMLC